MAVGKSSLTGGAGTVGRPLLKEFLRGVLCVIAPRLWRTGVQAPTNGSGLGSGCDGAALPVRRKGAGAGGSPGRGVR